MILGIGIDIVEVARMRSALEKGDALARRVLTPAEFDQFSKAHSTEHFLAKRFAAKEAIVKAIGTGIGNGVGWQHIQIEHDTLGKPKVIALESLRMWCEANAVKAIHLSIADEIHYAVANAVIECADATVV